MDVSKLKIHGATALVTMCALTFAAGTARANNTLLATPVVSGTVACGTLTGPGASQTITVKPASTPGSGVTITVTAVAPTGLVVTAPSPNTLTSANASAGIVFHVVAAPACYGLSSGTSSNTVQFKTMTGTISLANDAAPSVSTNVTVGATNGGSGLSAPAITVYCSKIGSTWIASSTPVTVSVTSTTPGGTPFTVDTSSGTSAWLSASSTAVSTASTTAATFTVSPIGGTSGCDQVATGSTTTGQIGLLNAPATEYEIAVTLKVITTTPLTANPTSISLSHVKNSGSQQSTSLAVTSSPSGDYFVVNTAAMPSWLTVNNPAAFAPATLIFSTTSVTDSLPPGTYTSTIYLQVSNYGDLPVPVTLFITNSAPKLTITTANPYPISWTLGSAYPTLNINLVSSDSPIPYTITTGGTLGPVVAATQLSGLAYSFGTTIAVSFTPTAFATAQPGTTLNGTVTFSWGSPAVTTVFAINLTVASPGATLTSLSPATLPTAGAGTQYTVVLQGSGFVGGTNGAINTKVGIVTGGVIVPDSSIYFNPNTSVSPSGIIATLTVPPATDALFGNGTTSYFSPTGNGGSVVIGVCNGYGTGTSPCTTPTGTATLTIGAGPIVQGVTSSSTFTEVTAPSLPAFAPYDMVSIFGVNFCAANGSGCGSATLLPGVLTSNTEQFATSLTPDAPAATDRLLSVNFYVHPYASGNTAYPAPLLFATNSQINAIVPGTISTGEYDVIVSFGCPTPACTTSTVVNSPPFPVNVVAADPGIFTIGSDGQGGAAALSTVWTLINNTNPANIRAGSSDSDIVHLYLTGLGAPNSTGDATATSSGCVAATGSTSYLTVLNTAAGLSGNSALTNIDGAVIQPNLLLSGNLAPCLTTEPTVTIGGVAVPSQNVTYAGFVAGTVAGLYQIDVKLPTNNNATFTSASGATIAPVASSTYGLVSPVQLPVQVTVGSVNSQSGVTLWVAPSLNVAAPSTITGTVGISWGSSNNSVVATEGTAPYHYAVTSGVLPAGLTLNALTGAISGEPGAGSGGTYSVTVTATDSAAIPVSGSVTFTLSVTADLYVISSGTAPYSVTYSTSSQAVTTALATGGTPAYAYTISPVLTGQLLVGSSTGAVTTNSLPGGTYSVTVSATDQGSLTGSTTFSLVIPLNVTKTTPLVAGAHGATTAITQVSATGLTGSSPTFALDAASVTAGFQIDSTGHLNANGFSASNAGPLTVTVTETDNLTAPSSSAHATGSITISGISVN